MTEYMADNGSVIDEQTIDEWARRAEQVDAGQPDEADKVTAFEGREWETHTRPMTVRTVRLPETTWRLVQRDARRQRISVSEWTRRAMNDELMRARREDA